MVPVTGRPHLTVLSERPSERSEYVQIVSWSNGLELCLLKSSDPISPTRPLNPYAPWMQGDGLLIARSPKTLVSITCIDNALDCLAAYNTWKAELQHACLFPGGAGYLVERAEHALLLTAARTNVGDVGQDGDEIGSRACKSSCARSDGCDQCE